MRIITATEYESRVAAVAPFERLGRVFVGPAVHVKKKSIEKLRVGNINYINVSYDTMNLLAEIHIYTVWFGWL